MVNADCGGGARGRRAVPGACMLRSRASRSCWEGCAESSDDRIRAKKDGQNVFLSSLFTRNTVSHVFSVRGSGVVLPFILVGPPSAHKCRRVGILKCSKRAEKDPKRAAACRAPPRVCTQHGASTALVPAATYIFSCSCSSCGTFLALEKHPGRVRSLERRPFDGHRARRGLFQRGMR